MAKPGIDLATLSEQDVVLQARDGRQAAYRELVRRYERPIFSLIYRMVRNREQAEDLAQETFVKALHAIESYRPEYKFSSWIFKIANNAAIDQLRRREVDIARAQSCIVTRHDGVSWSMFAMPLGSHPART